MMVTQQINDRLNELLGILNAVCSSIEPATGYVHLRNDYYDARAGAIAFVEHVFGRDNSLHNELLSITPDCFDQNVFRLQAVLRAAKAAD